MSNDPNDFIAKISLRNRILLSKYRILLSKYREFSAESCYLLGLLFLTKRICVLSGKSERAPEYEKWVMILAILSPKYRNKIATSYQNIAIFPLKTTIRDIDGDVEDPSDLIAKISNKIATT